MAEVAAEAKACFTPCKDIAPKAALALQILGYSVLSLLGENVEASPEVHIHTFKESETPLQGIVEAVEICPLLWELCASAAPTASTLLPILLTLDTATKTQEDLDQITDAILHGLRQIKDPYQIIEELLENETLAEDRVDSLIALITHKKTTFATSTPPINRSRTLRVKGRRALTPVRSHRHRKQSSLQ